MALTKAWVRSTLGPLVRPNLPVGRFLFLTAAAAPTRSSTLLRTIVSLETQVLVGANTGTVPPANWWSTSYTEMRASWYQDFAHVTTQPPLNDGTKQLVSRTLARTSFEPIVSTPGIYVIRFDQPDIDTPVQRKSDGTAVPGVWMQIYHTDSVSALNGTFDTVITLSGYLDTLWGDVL